MIRKWLITPIMVIFLVWASGFVYFIYHTWSYKIDNSHFTDAIVVFTGGKSRIKVAVSLVKAGYAPLMFVAGVDSLDQLNKYLTENGIKLDQVFYSFNNNTTTENAKEIAEFVNTHFIKSIRLVTASYHMTRALAEIKKLLPRGITIIAHPVLVDNNDYYSIFTEYNKYLVTQFLK